MLHAIAKIFVQVAGRIRQPRLPFVATCCLLALPAGVQRPCAAATCTPAPAGVVSWWRAEGNANDCMGLNPGALVSGATFGPGVVGQAFTFNGAGSCVEVPHHASLNLTNEFTLELWYKEIGGSQWAYGLVAKRNAANQCNFGINVDTTGATTLQVYYNDPTVASPGVFEKLELVPAPAPGLFHHIAATFRQASSSQVELDLFVDGQLVKNQVLAGNLANTLNDAPLTIGATTRAGGEFLRGSIDEVTIYRRALTATEVATLYQVGSGGKCPDSVPPYVWAYANDNLLSGPEATFIGDTQIRLQSSFPGGSIFFTLDGSEASFLSQVYSGPFWLRSSAGLRTVAYSLDYLKSAYGAPIDIRIIPTYELTVVPAGGGTVTITPPGGVYASNTVVTLQAVPDPGWVFMGWQGQARTELNMVIEMTHDQVAQAVFGTELHTAVSGAGQIVAIPDVARYPHGSVVQLVAVPEAGQFLGAWGGTATGRANPYYLVVTNPASLVSAVFATLEDQQVTLVLRSEGSGRVTASPSSNLYEVGASVRLVAEPDPREEFVEWQGDATGTTPSLNVLLDGSKSITAHFTSRPVVGAMPPLGGLLGNGFAVTLTGELSEVYTISRSTDLQEWLRVTTFTNVFGMTQWVDTGAKANGLGFYRGEKK